MLGDQFPSRGRECHLIARNARVCSQFAQARLVYVFALCAALIACAGPSWPGGIRAQLALSPRGLRVIEVPPDSPAQRAGLQVDDAIVSIDGTPVAGLTGQRIHELLSGEVGSPVELVFQRNGTQQTLRIARAPYGK